VKIFLRILTMARPHLPYLLGSMACAIIFALLSAVNVWMFIPFLENIFSPETAIVEQPGPEPGADVNGDFLERAKSRLRDETNRIVVGKDRRSSLRRVCVLLLALFFLKNLSGYAQGYLMARVEQGVSRDVKNALYEHLQRLSLSFFHRAKAGHLISRVTNDVMLLNEAINAGLINLLRDPLLVVSYLLIMLILSWKLTLLAFLAFPLGLRVVIRIGKKLRKYTLRSQEKVADVTAVLEETITGVRVVKAFSMEKFEIDKFRRETQKLFSNALKLTRVRRLASPLTEFLGAALIVTVLWIGGGEVISNRGLAPEEFMVFLGALLALMQPVKSLSQVNSRIQIGIGAGQRIFEILDEVPEISDSPDAIDIPGFRESIRFRNVSARYDSGDLVLRNINLEVRAGEVVAIVGPSGAGKSTLVDLLPRFYDPVEGSIEIDGIDIRRIRLRSLRKLMGIVTQETILFNDTVRNNIAYGMPDISDEEVIEAARIANAHDFITQLPEGYNTFIGDRGVKLSGGQRQRIAIARAVLKNPPILILDEATSSLDAESEIAVQEAIDRLLKGRTVFVIAHRLSTIQKADRIIVLENGRVVQEGRHGELMRQEGLYKKLYELQMRK